MSRLEPHRTRALLCGALMLVVVVSSRPAAHEIPNDVTVQTFVKADGQRLRFLVRVPLASMADINWPQNAPGLLDLGRADAALRHAATLWIADQVTLYEGDRPLTRPHLAAIRASLPAEGGSFSSYEGALGYLTGPPAPDGTEVPLNVGVLDALFEYEIASAGSRFSIEPRFGRLGLKTVTVVRAILPDGAVRAFEIEGNPGLVRLDPEWFQAAWRFVALGFRHILDGVDHLLFLVCLVVPVRRFRQLLLVVTAFTIAHSITLVASAYNVGPDALWFPPLIEMLIAASIVYMALENIIGAKLQSRWMVAFAFGLVHGFGFSFALRNTLQFAGSHLLTSLLSFNLGVELGQVLVLALLIPTLAWTFRFVVQERAGTIILSALVAHTGWHWMTERAGVLSQYQFRWPVLTAALLADVLGWLMLAVAVAGGLWLAGVLRNFTRHKRSPSPTRISGSSST